MNYNPSVYAHTVSGGIMIMSIIYVALNSNKLGSKDPYQTLVLLLLFSVATGVHGISHLGLETVYNYNPYSVMSGEILEPLDCPCPCRRKCSC
jgi:hypothetical protein